MVSWLLVEYCIIYKEIMDDNYFVVCSLDVFYFLCCYIDDFVVLVFLVLKVKLYRDLVLLLIFMVLDKFSNFDVYVFSSIKQFLEEEKVDFVIVYIFVFYVVFLWVVISDIEFY